MSAVTVWSASRPARAPYLLMTAVLAAAWLALVGWLQWQSSPGQMSTSEISEMTMAMRWGVGGIVGIALTFFSLHWIGKWAFAETQPATTTHVELPVPVLPPAALRGIGDQFALEIRGIGVVVDRWGQTEITDRLAKQASGNTSILPADPTGYPELGGSRRSDSNLRLGIAFGNVAGKAMAYWPTPTFALGPPNQPESRGAATSILAGANGATLGVTLFLWQDDANTTSGQGTIERLFEFFDANPDVPSAVVFSVDGDVKRDNYRVIGTPSSIKDEHTVPTVFDSLAGFLVTRTDRVDRYLRPFAVAGKENNQDTSTDFGKHWKFYWSKSYQFDDEYAAAENKRLGRVDAMSPGTLPSAWWHAKLPELWKTLDNKGPGDFHPSPWLPVRWTTFQLAEFDAAPVLGYLHRPIRTALADESGKPTKPALQVKALQAAWEHALATLPEGVTPARVLYDSTHDVQGATALTLALHGLNKDGHGLDLQDVNEGYDIGRRLGNTGVSAALVELGLGTMLSYQHGGASAAVYRGSDGSMTVQMVSPPDDATKAANLAKTNQHATPFKRW